MDKLEQKIQDLFIENQWSLGIAESCTGGAIAACLTKIPGASNYFKGAVVCYADSLKETLLNVSQKTLTTFGAVSQETVLEMVSGLLVTLDTDYGIAISGIAGPTGGSSDKPVGTVWIATCKKESTPYTLCIQAHGDRQAIIAESVQTALHILLNYANQFKKH